MLDLIDKSAVAQKMGFGNKRSLDMFIKRHPGFPPPAERGGGKGKRHWWSRKKVEDFLRQYKPYQRKEKNNN